MTRIKYYRGWQAAMAVALLAFSQWANALGLGSARVDSYLGQPLQVRVDLISRSEAELATVTASMASAADHRVMGLPPPRVGMPLEFLVNRELSDPHIMVTGRLPMNEPVMQLVVEVVWAGGRMLKQYTLFFDPPTFPAAAPLPAPRATASRPASPAPGADREATVNTRIVPAPSSQTRPFVDEAPAISEAGSSLSSESPAKGLADDNSAAPVKPSTERARQPEPSTAAGAGAAVANTGPPFDPIVTSKPVVPASTRREETVSSAVAGADGSGTPAPGEKDTGVQLMPQQPPEVADERPAAGVEQAVSESEIPSPGIEPSSRLEALQAGTDEMASEPMAGLDHTAQESAAEEAIPTEPVSAQVQPQTDLQEEGSLVVAESEMPEPSEAQATPDLQQLALGSDPQEPLAADAIGPLTTTEQSEPADTGMPTPQGSEEPAAESATALAQEPTPAVADAPPTLDESEALESLATTPEAELGDGPAADLAQQTLEAANDRMAGVNELQQEAADQPPSEDAPADPAGSVSMLAEASDAREGPELGQERAPGDGSLADDFASVESDAPTELSSVAADGVLDDTSDVSPEAPGEGAPDELVSNESAGTRMVEEDQVAVSTPPEPTMVEQEMLEQRIDDGDEGITDTLAQATEFDQAESGSAEPSGASESAGAAENLPDSSPAAPSDGQTQLVEQAAQAPETVDEAVFEATEAAIPPPIDVVFRAVAGPAPAASAGQVHTVASGETLWSLSQQWAKTRGVDVNQMMLAVQRQNPQAFMGENINRMMAGSVLRLPPQQTAQRISANEAMLEVLRQERMLLANQVPQGPENLPSVADLAQNAAPAANADAQVLRGDERSRLELVPPSDTVDETLQEFGQGNSGDEGVAVGESLVEELARTQEELVNARQENQYLSERIEELEGELGRLQSGSDGLVADTNLAEMEQRLRDQRRSGDGAQELQITPSNDAEEAWYARFGPWVLGLMLLLLVAVIALLRTRAQRASSTLQPPSDSASS